MYLSFYGLAEKPFSQTPDPKFLYWNDAYRETIASLRYGIQERKGFVTMIGEAGTGKTTLLRKLLDDLGPDVVSVFLFNPNATFEEILEYTLSELGIPAASGRKLAMLQRLNDFLLAAFAEGKNTILVIDEAQDLETEVLESLRLLSNLETAKEKILQIVLAGQPELATRLAQPNLRQLKQRIAVRCRVEPLGRHELAEFIKTRLAVAGSKPDLFCEETLDPIWSFAHGIPRLVNTVCDNALLVGYALGRSTIDASVIDEVIADLCKLDAPIVLTPVAPLPAASAPPPAAAPPVAPPPAEPPVATVASAAPAPVAQAAPPTVSPASGAAAPSAEPVPPRPEPAWARRSASAPGAESAPRTAPRAASAPSAPSVERRRRRGAAWVALLLLAVAGTWVAGGFDGITPRARDWLAEAGFALPGGAESTTARPAVVPAPAPPAPLAAPQPAAPSLDTASATGAPVAAPAPPAAAEQAAHDLATVAPDDVAAPPPAPAAAPVDAEHDASAPVAPQAPRAPAAEPRPAPEPLQPAAAPPEPEPVAPSAQVASVPSVTERVNRQDLQARRVGGRAKRVQVQRGDTLMNLAMREYGYANYTTLDVLRSANPGIQDVNRIIAGSEIVFPDPGPSSRVISEREGVSVLVATTPVLYQAQELQRVVGSRYRVPAELEPVALGDGRNLYRVSLRQLPDKSQAQAIAEALGSILRDPS